MKLLFAGLAIGAFAGAGALAVFHSCPTTAVHQEAPFTKADLDRIDASLKAILESVSPKVEATRHPEAGIDSGVPAGVESPASDAEPSHADGSGGNETLAKHFTMLWRCSRNDSLGIVKVLEESGVSPFDAGAMTATDSAYKDLQGLQRQLLADSLRIRHSLGVPDDIAKAEATAEQMRRWVEDTKRATEQLSAEYELQRQRRLDEYRRQLSELAR